MILERGAFGRWLGHRSRTLMYGISALIKKAPKSPIVPSAMWGHSVKTRSMNQEAGPQQTPNLLGTLILDFSAFRTVWKKFVADNTPGPWYSVTAAQTDQESTTTCLNVSSFLF